MTVRIEPAGPGDATIVERFVAAIQEHERADVPELRTGAEIAVEYAARVNRMVLAHDGILLLAWDGETAVGLVAAWKSRDDDPLLAAEYREHGYISDLYVAETHRRRGVARDLLAAAETAMRARGCRRLSLSVKAVNLGARMLYEAEGFQPYELSMWKPLDRSG